MRRMVGGKFILTVPDVTRGGVSRVRMSSPLRGDCGRAGFRDA
jgi:hypothetical protein